MFFSFIIPVYNRPFEVEELLYSMTRQEEAPPFEVVIVEDGSTLSCEDVVRRFETQLNIRYIAIPNGGPGNARNVGAMQATGDYLLILDSDVVLPAHYLCRVAQALTKHPECDAFGGPDAARENFTPIQKAINYSMTSMLTTGGIRGHSVRLTKRFYPRSFNLGCRSSVYRSLEGFTPSMRFGEDIDLALRLYAKGYRVQLFEEAWVWHRRRIDLKKFFKQVFNSGIARVHLSRRHPGSMRWVYLLPSLFTLGLFGWLIASCFIPILWWGFLLLGLIIIGDALRATREFQVALLALPASLTQLLGYGSGYLYASFRCYLLRSSEFSAFDSNFYQ